MPENAKTRRRRLYTNKLILNAAIKKTPVFDAFKNLQTIGRRMSYVDFEWRYYQFYNGNRDLTIEKSRDNSSPVTFSNLPMDVVKKVVGKLPLIERLVVRKVSRNLQNLVDSTEIHCEQIGFAFGNTHSNITHKQWNLSYDQMDDRHCQVIANRNWQPKTKTRNCNFRKIMMADASAFLKNPKLRIERFVCKAFKNKTFFEFLRTLKSLNILLDVRSVSFKTDHDIILPILQFLKPKTLEEISLVVRNVTIEHLNEIAGTDQWKLAKKLHWNWYLKGFQMEKLLHFKEIRIERLQLTDRNLVAVRDILLTSAHLEVCKLTSWCFEHRYHVNANNNERNINKIFGQDPAYDSGTRQFATPASRDYFQLEFQRDDSAFTLTLTRMSQKNE